MKIHLKIGEIKRVIAFCLLFSLIFCSNCFAYTLTEVSWKGGDPVYNFSFGSTINLNCGDSLVYSGEDQNLRANDYWTYKFRHVLPSGGYEYSGSFELLGSSWGSDLKRSQTTLISSAKSSDAGKWERGKEWRASSQFKSYSTLVYVNVVHNYSLISETPATCTEKGAKVYGCRCGEGKTEEYGDPAGHQNAPEAQEGGYFRTRCTVCNEILQETPITYTVSYDGNGADIGDMSSLTEQYTYGQEKQLYPNSYERVGYTFDGWKFGEQIFHDEETVQDLTTVSNDLVALAAIWKPNKYTINYDSNGGSSIDSLTADYNSPIGPLPEPHRTGYTFRGWFTSPAGGDPITEDTLIPLDGAMYYARWTPNTYTVNFDITSGSNLIGTNWIEVIYDKLYGVLPTPRKMDHFFMGWFTENGEKSITDPDKASPSDGQKATNSEAMKATPSNVERATASDAIKATPSNGERATASEAIKATTSNSERATTSEATKVPSDVNIKTEHEITDIEISTISNASKLSLPKSNTTEKLSTASSALKASASEAENFEEADTDYEEEDEEEDPSEETDGEFLLINDLEENFPFPILYLNDETDESDWGEQITANSICQIASDHTLYARWLFVANGNPNGTNTRPGMDGSLNTDDDNVYWDGEDGIPGTDDDRLVYPGDDGIYGTEDDYYIDDSGNNVYAGQDCNFSTSDDFIDNQNNTNTRPGPDHLFGTSNDELWWNGKDGLPGNADDKPIYPGNDGIYGTEDDYYIDDSGNNVYAGQDCNFNTNDDFIDNQNDTNTRPGPDGWFNQLDDELWWNGSDGLPGNADDKLIYPGKDSIYGTEDDYYIDDSGNNVYTGQDGNFGSSDDYIDNQNNTNTRPGPDHLFGTSDDELWWNGKDGLPGNADDKLIYPGDDGIYGTEDDYYIDEDGNKVFAGSDGLWGTEDDYWVTVDGQIVKPGPDRIFGTPDDYIDNQDGSHIRTGSDGLLFTEDDELWFNGPDGIPWTGDDFRPKKVHSTSSNTKMTIEKRLGATPGRWDFNAHQNVWRFYYEDGSPAKSHWEYLYYGPTGRTDWYYFDNDGIMQTGFLSLNNATYYLHEEPDGTRGHMYVGWNLIHDDWYYLGSTGALYVNTVTPDGYSVDAAGKWIH